jgi:ABC-type spermidine/putrescine transport system permease subunit II
MHPINPVLFGIIIAIPAIAVTVFIGYLISLLFRKKEIELTKLTYYANSVIIAFISSGATALIFLKCLESWHPDGLTPKLSYSYSSMVLSHYLNIELCAVFIFLMTAIAIRIIRRNQKKRIKNEEQDSDEQ